ncbi:unnamed protein product [Paramecium sonneborni]|uniref:Uncharacterized protein n=1 Tax=Paramecium sonneborni TaxID=65129 RepID=A0A8S1PR34_9CILI|nr:unnamed protein product [Paramecium sonneborni]
MKKTKNFILGFLTLIRLIFQEFKNIFILQFRKIFMHFKIQEYQNQTAKQLESVEKL